MTPRPRGQEGQGIAPVLGKSIISSGENYGKRRALESPEQGGQGWLRDLQFVFRLFYDSCFLCVNACFGLLLYFRLFVCLFVCLLFIFDKSSQA